MNMRSSPRACLVPWKTVRKTYFLWTMQFPICLVSEKMSWKGKLSWKEVGKWLFSFLPKMTRKWKWSFFSLFSLGAPFFPPKLWTENFFFLFHCSKQQKLKLRVFLFCVTQKILSMGDLFLFHGNLIFLAAKHTLSLYGKLDIKLYTTLELDFNQSSSQNPNLIIPFHPKPLLFVPFGYVTLNQKPLSAIFHFSSFNKSFQKSV